MNFPLLVINTFIWKSPASLGWPIGWRYGFSQASVWKTSVFELGVEGNNVDRMGELCSTLWCPYVWIGFEIEHPACSLFSLLFRRQITKPRPFNSSSFQTMGPQSLKMICGQLTLRTLLVWLQRCTLNFWEILLQRTHLVIFPDCISLVLSFSTITKNFPSVTLRSLRTSVTSDTPMVSEALPAPLLLPEAPQHALALGLTPSLENNIFSRVHSWVLYFIWVAALDPLILLLIWKRQPVLAEC